MSNNNLKRLPRLTAILVKLQTKKLLTAFELADDFSLSVRTIYRDIRALEKAGVPIITQEGKGYSLKEGYNVPPVMFTEKQANALILVEQLVLKNKDKSIVKDYSEAIEKIKAVLDSEQKEKIHLLIKRTHLDQNYEREKNSNNLSDLQIALTNCYLINIEYTNEKNIITRRQLEPFALLSTQNWLLLAKCRLRNEFRFFRLDRIGKLELLPEKFPSHNMSLQEYFDRYY
ncbi:hypothetical protein LPTSP3_g25980 [Leptospira kobayashii]|uniref:HTH deoR-type domain-containing protein n=1 Tax=Leptospira kobayashii TaxID=1917830 RepID=A0ABM7UL52_9LEPT|nr:HTH domain-containing protein [Leptospira kobayashii]BDA79668.1 hypothetical protein LPTSP3_g25980 [Leptospira kobayashii]